MKIENIFSVLTDDPDEAKMLKAKADLMIKISNKKEELNVSQKEFAKLAKTTQPKISNIVNGKMSALSIDWLMVVASRVGVYQMDKGDGPGPIIF